MIKLKPKPLQHHHNKTPNNYKKIVDLLTQTEQKILPSEDSKPSEWTDAIIQHQIEVLQEILKIEKENISIIKEETKRLKTSDSRFANQN